MSVTTNPSAQCYTLEDVNPQTPLQEPQILQFVQYNPCQTQIQIHFSQNESFVRLILVFLSPSRQWQVVLQLVHEQCLLSPFQFVFCQSS